MNNAGIWRPGRVTDLTEKTWDQVIDTNLKGIFLVSKEIIPIMLKAGDGSIVNIASVAGLVGASVLVVDGGFTASFELYRIFDQYLTCE